MLVVVHQTCLPVNLDPCKQSIIWRRAVKAMGHVHSSLHVIPHLVRGFCSLIGSRQGELAKADSSFDTHVGSALFWIFVYLDWMF